MLNIKTDSRKIKKGDTFVALKGYYLDGHDFIKQAIDKGATKIIAEHGTYDVETLIVPNSNDYLCKYLSDNYKNEFDDMTIIGITGTNGKTTTCFLIYNSLLKLNKKVAYIGTIGFYINKKKIKDLPNSTPEILEVYNLLLACKENNIKYVIMEISSHALELKRIYGIKFDIALFTNLTQDHLDFHHTMENYSNAKRKLFTKLRNNKLAIINIDSKYHKKMILEKNNNITYGFNKSDYQILDYKFSSKYSIINFKYKNNIYEIHTSLIGKHNAYNIISCISILHELGFDINTIINIIPSLKTPPGRMEKINYKDNLIIIDFAHTPDALINIISSTKNMVAGKCITLFGCTGNRDKTKRPKMANISLTLSDFSIFTTDDPWDEKPESIIKDMISNPKNNNYKVVLDRTEAIKYGINMLNKNDLLLILGRGSEKYQYWGKSQIELDDKLIVQEIINNNIH